MAPPEDNSWQRQVSELLARAAQLCVEHGVDLDSFVRGAYSSYVQANPGMREYLEELQLKAALDEMRRVGRMASA